MANRASEPFVLDFPDGQRVEDILKKADADYSRAEIDALLSKKPGEITTGKQYVIDEQTVTADDGAEAFNDLTNNKASGKHSHAEGTRTTSSGDYSHAEGGGTTASGDNSHAEGAGTEASGNYSHAEGAGSKATGEYSHAEGGSTTASGALSHAEGGSTTASGAQSHAEGASTTASGDYSHAEGTRTIASSKNQHVQGKYNVEDAEGKFAFIIGNGDYGARHNAFAIDWNGLIYVNGSPTGMNVATLASDLAALTARVQALENQ